MQMDTVAIRPGDTGAAAARPSSAQSAGCGRALVRQPSSLAEESFLGEPSFTSLAAPPPGHLAPPPAALEALLERGSPSPFEPVVERASPSPFEPVLERASPSLSPPPSPPLLHPAPPSVPPSPPAEKHECAQQAVTDIGQATRHPIGMGTAAGSEGGREGTGTVHSVDKSRPTSDAGDGSGQEEAGHRRMLSHDSTQRAMRAWWRRRRRAAGDSEARMPCWKQYFVLFLGSLVVGACTITVTVLFAIIPPVTQYFVLFSFAGSVPTSLMLHIVTRSAVRYVRKRRALARGRSVEGAFTWQKHAAKHTTRGFRRVRKGSEQEQQQARRELRLQRTLGGLYDVTRLSANYAFKTEEPEEWRETSVPTREDGTRPRAVTGVMTRGVPPSISRQASAFVINEDAMDASQSLNERLAPRGRVAAPAAGAPAHHRPSVKWDSSVDSPAAAGLAVISEGSQSDEYRVAGEGSTSLERRLQRAAYLPEAADFKDPLANQAGGGASGKAVTRKPRHPRVSRQEADDQKAAAEKAAAERLEALRRRGSVGSGPSGVASTDTYHV